jgi:hypothetical protein
MNFASRECVKVGWVFASVPPLLAVKPAHRSDRNRGAGNLFGGIGHSVAHAPSGAGGPVGVSAFQSRSLASRIFRRSQIPALLVGLHEVDSETGHTTRNQHTARYRQSSNLDCLSGMDIYSGPVPPTHFEPVEQTSLDTDIISG